MKTFVLNKFSAIAAAFFASAAMISLTANADPQTGDGFHHMWGGGWYMMLMGPFSMILFLVVLVAAVVLVVKWLLPNADRSAPSGSSARAILDERFARGEIDAEEYKAKREAIEN
jgi:putative membrane protein